MATIEIFVDGAVSGNGSGREIGGAAVYVPELDYRASKRLEGRSNNECEYVAVIAALKTALHHGWSDVVIYCDSKLVIEQTLGNWKVRHPRLRPYAAQAQELVARIANCTIVHIPGHGKCQDARLARCNAICDRLAVEAKGLAA